MHSNRILKEKILLSLFIPLTVILTLYLAISFHTLFFREILININVIILLFNL